MTREYKKVGQYQSLMNFGWSRSKAGYYLDFGAKLRPGDEHYLEANQLHQNLEIDSALSPFIIEKIDSTDYFSTFLSTNPIAENPSLFLEFAGLDGSDESFLEFANKYGLLTKGLELGLELSTEIRGLYYQRPAMGESLKAWQDEHTYFKTLVNGWENIKDIPSDKLRYKFFTVHVNIKLDRYPIKANLSIDSPKLFFAPDTLIGAMYFQFAQTIAGEKKYKKCEVCHKWEDVTEKKATWTKHPECAGRMRTAKYRERLKQKERS